MEVRSGKWEVGSGKVGKELFEEPFDDSPVHPAAVGVDVGFSYESEVTAVFGEAESDVGGEVNLGEWFAADDGVIEGSEDCGVDANSGDDGCGGGFGVVFIGREEAGGWCGVEFVEVIESAWRSAGAGDGKRIIPLR